MKQQSEWHDLIDRLYSQNWISNDKDLTSHYENMAVFVLITRTDCRSITEHVLRYEIRSRELIPGTIRGGNVGVSILPKDISTVVLTGLELSVTNSGYNLVHCLASYNRQSTSRVLIKIIQALCILKLIHNSMIYFIIRVACGPSSLTIMNQEPGHTSRYSTLHHAPMHVSTDRLLFINESFTL